MTDLTALQPCPFCGGKGSMSKNHDPDGSGAFHFIQCGKCRAKGAEFYAVETCPIFYGQVRDAWNTRAPDLAMAKRLERAEAVVRRFATALSMIETEISSAETYNPAISAIVRGELDWADEQYVSAAFRGESG